MIRSIPVLAAAMTLAAGLAFAQGKATTPEVIARQTTMDTIAANMKVLSEMAGGKTAFEATAARTAAASVAAAAARAPEVFAPNVTEAASRASPRIWSDQAAFLAQARKLLDGANAIDPTSVETLKATLGGAGGACRDCHTTFRL